MGSVFGVVFLGFLVLLWVREGLVVDFFSFSFVFVAR